jgi:hypothetical protein
MLKSSSFLPDFSAATSHRGFSPRPAQVSVGFSGLRYFGATAPRGPPRPPLARDPSVVRRSSLPSWSCIARRSSMTLVLRAASTCSLSFDNLSIDIDLRFIGGFMGVPLLLLSKSIYYETSCESITFWQRFGYLPGPNDRLRDRLSSLMTRHLNAACLQTGPREQMPSQCRSMQQLSSCMPLRCAKTGAQSPLGPPT